MGRFLEHSRVFHFRNAGNDEYFIGSADMRPRNLRRRVELLVPVMGPVTRARLDQILDAYLKDPTAWVLAADGSYVRRRAGDTSTQDALLDLGVNDLRLGVQRVREVGAAH
jgi:polyphosphate kinase